MYKLSPPTLYAFDGALSDPRCLRRIEEMLRALEMNGKAVNRVRHSDIPDMIRQNNWQNAWVRQGNLGRHADPALVFATLRMEGAEDPSATLKMCPPGTPPELVRHLLGHGGKGLHREGANSGRVCRNRYQFDTIYGCPHGCRYCRGGQVAVIFTNIEEFVEKEVIPTARQNPWQKVFMFNSWLTDQVAFEPEYGLSKLLMKYYASTPDQHYLIHTKSANVDFLRGFGHRGHTIMLWSLTSETVSRLIEPGSASTEERIEAARRCQEAGYPVRFKFKPIVPVRNWRKECRRMIEMVFARTRPDNVGMCMLAWMSAEELKVCIDESLLDPAYVKAVEECAKSMKGVATGPFPQWVRAEVYGFFLDEIRKHDKSVPVFLSTESPEMWRDFAPRLGVNPSNYVCGCGPQCVPGMKRLGHLESVEKIA